MNNWEEIHENFDKNPTWSDKTYQQHWEEASLTYEDAQQWIPVGFTPYDYYEVKQWKTRYFTPQQAKTWIEIGLNKENAEFAAYLRGNKGMQLDLSLNLEKLRAEFNSWLKKNKPVQEYLDIIYSPEKRKETTWLNISQKNLEGNADLSDFMNLSELDCSGNNLTSLKLNNCSQLKAISCHGNQLTNLDLSNCAGLVKLDSVDNELTNLALPKDASNLKTLYLSNNNFHQDLSFLKEVVNLEKLFLANNKFIDSLEPLKEMGRLRTLSISNTDINSGLEYLSNSVEYFSCLANLRKDAKCQVIYNLLANDQGEVETDSNGNLENFTQKLKDLKNNWIKLGFTDQQMKAWTKAGAKLNDYEFVVWLKNVKDYGPKWITNYQEDYQILSENFKNYGLCSECHQLNTGNQWCKDCNVPRLEREFTNWTSGNPQIDQFIQKYQLQATDADKFIEWIPYEQFKDVEYLAEGGFGKVYKAKWTVGNIHHWDNENNQWIREKDCEENLIRQIKSKLSILETSIKSAKTKLRSNSKFSETKREEREEKLKSFFSNFPIAPRKFIKSLENIKPGLSGKLTAEEINNLCQNKSELIQLQKEFKELVGKRRQEVVLKSLNNSQNNTEFLKETEKHKIIDDWFNNVVPCYGISQDPHGNYLMVMKYIEGGDLRKYLKSKKLNFKDKLLRLVNISQGLKDIHQKGLVHRDFHPGNILNSEIHSFITDLGLCKPVSEVNQEKEIYGVLPYVAPEVLRKENYTPASDIYSWGIVAYEVLSGLPPYVVYDEKEKCYKELPHEHSLAEKICQGLRPRFEVKIPQLLKDLIESCWDADSARRPTANELSRILNNWVGEVNSQKNTEFFEQFKDKKQFLDNLVALDYKTHPSTLYTSRRLDLKNLPESQNSKEINEIFYSSDSKQINLEIPDNLDQLNLSEEDQQIAQIQQTKLPKPGNNN